MAFTELDGGANNPVHFPIRINGGGVYDAVKASIRSTIAGRDVGAGSVGRAGDGYRGDEEVNE